eukprot:sb/3478289/
MLCRHYDRKKDVVTSCCTASYSTPRTVQITTKPNKQTNECSSVPRIAHHDPTTHTELYQLSVRTHRVILYRLNLCRNCNINSPSGTAIHRDREDAGVIELIY